MPRIVSGFAGSLSLAVPKSGTRPTSDRTREAVFSALDARDAVRASRVLDLFAGSGALGLEAASRGASTVVLVERNAAAAAVCRKNAAAVVKAARGTEPPDVRIVASTVKAFLAAAQPAYEIFELVFIDPPYDLAEPELADVLCALLPLLATDAVVLVERSSRSPEPLWPAGLDAERRRAYGETVVYTATRT